jgi:hypothetical protein
MEVEPRNYRELSENVGQELVKSVILIKHKSEKRPEVKWMWRLKDYKA